MKHHHFLTTLLALLCATGAAAAPTDLPQTDDDWQAFLSQHDLTWDTLTADPVRPSFDHHLRTGYYAGAIMGNGLIGTNLYRLDARTYRLNIGRSDVTEARQPYNLYNSARLPIGYFTLRPVGRPRSERLRLSLYDATTQGTLITDSGRIRLRTYVHATEPYAVVETAATGAEADYAWDFTPQQAVSPRHVLHHNAPAGYVNHLGQSNPAPRRLRQGGCELLVQHLVTDTTFSHTARVYVVAWQESRPATHRRRITMTVAQAPTERQAIRQAVRTLHRAAHTQPEAAWRTHTQWWHGLYRQAAFLTFPDARVEAFYWTQYYKFASTARPDCPPVDLQGVWPTWDTPWTAIWANLNLQLTYSWQAKANLGFLAQPLWDALWRHRRNLQRNVTDIPAQRDWTDAACLGRTCSYDFLAPLDPALAATNQYEAGNLIWLLYYYWQHCRAYADERQLTHRFMPLLEAAVNLFFHIRTTGPDGRYHLPPTASPEYASRSVGPDCNYDLASLRWGLRTLLHTDSALGLHNRRRAAWQDFERRLTPFPYDSVTGYRVSQTTPFLDTSHRHYSHLFMIYPYRMVNWEQPAMRPRISLSVERWRGNQGYSRTGKAAMLLMMGRADEAWQQMQTFLDRFVKPNTLYAETGPVIETPLAAMSTLHDFYLQDWGGCIRVFPAVPREWPDASFAGMRADGAFLVSATRRGGRTVSIDVECEQGGTLRLRSDMAPDDCHVTSGGQPVSYRTAGNQLIINTRRGQHLRISRRNMLYIAPAPLEHPAEAHNPYGQRRADIARR